MRTNTDLDRLDAATLRAWRASNLIGWGIVGVAVAFLLVTAASVVVERLVEEGVAWANGLSFVMAVVAGTAGGMVIGSRVYRAPGTVAFCSFTGLLLVWLAWQLVVVGNEWGLIEVAVQWLFSLLWVLPAVIAARVTWRGRPTALRSGPPATA